MLRSSLNAMTHHSCLQSSISDMNEFSVIWSFERLMSCRSFKSMTLYIMSSWFLTLLSFASLTAWIIFWAKDRDSRRLNASWRVYFSFSIELIVTFDDWLNCLISSWAHSSRLSSFSYFTIRFSISSSVYHHSRASSRRLSYRLIYINSSVLRIIISFALSRKRWMFLKYMFLLMCFRADSVLTNLSSYLESKYSTSLEFQQSLTFLLSLESSNSEESRSSDEFKNFCQAEWSCINWAMSLTMMRTSYSEFQAIKCETFCCLCSSRSNQSCCSFFSWWSCCSWVNISFKFSKDSMRFRENSSSMKVWLVNLFILSCRDAKEFVSVELTLSEISSRLLKIISKSMLNLDLNEMFSVKNELSERIRAISMISKLIDRALTISAVTVSKLHTFVQSCFLSTTHSFDHATELKFRSIKSMK